MKSRDGKPLSDAYLVSEASKLYPWLKNVYEKTSGFVHLSQPHMIAPLVKIAKDGTVGIEVGRGLGREWKEDEVLESLSALEEATKSVLHLCHSWLVTKDIAGKRRKGINVLYPPDSTAYP